MSLAAYLPIDRYQALRQNADLSDTASGAALFVDISGFTALAEALVAELGPRLGGEELTRYLNVVYDNLLEPIHLYHGSIINFSGDAATCWFDNPDDLTLAAHRAITAALQMQTVIKRTGRIKTQGGQQLSLAVKIAVAAGQVRRFVVGDPAIQQIDVLAGAIMERLSQAEQLAAKNEVIVSTEVVELLGARLQGVEERGSASKFAVIADLTEKAEAAPWQASDDEDMTLADLQRWLLPVIQQRMAAGFGDFLTELRPVTAFFLRFSGLDYDTDPAAQSKLNAFIQWVQATLNFYEGNLLEITIGDKGNNLYAVFGAPVAHQDDAERAVRAGQKLLQPPAELDWVQNISLGISSGTMRTGAYGSSRYRQVYGVQGDEVNVAARLMQAAQPGQMLVSQRVRDLAGPLIVWQNVTALTVKGKSKPVNAHQLLEIRERGGPAQPSQTGMVNRQSELAAISQALTDFAAQPTGSNLILIEGEPGIGKSRLANEAVRLAGQHHLTVWQGAGDAIEQTRPYHGWINIISKRLGLSDSDELAAQQTQALEVIHSLRPDLEQLAPLLNQVVPLQLPENDLTEQMQGQIRADNTRELLLALLGNSPAVVVLEDAHWLDSASLALANAIVASETLPLLVLATTRPIGENVGPEYQTLTESAGFTIKLDKLGEAETAALVCQRLKVSELPPVISKLIYQKAEGYPFFSEELAYALRDAGFIVIENGTCRLASSESDIESLNLPDTVQGVITSRIDRLTPAQQLTLKVASVIGRVFTFRNLEGVYPVSQDKGQLADYVGTLDRLDITPLERWQPEPSYLFRHVITQEVAYNLMLYAQRRQLHQAVAQWYEDSQGSDLSAYYPLLAYHWNKAEVTDKTITYLEKAGQQAARDGAYREAVYFLEELFKLVQEKGLAFDDLRVAGWEARLGEAYQGLGRMKDSQTHYERGLDRVGFSVPKTPRAVMLTLLGQNFRQLLHRLFPGFFYGRWSNRKSQLEMVMQIYPQLGQTYIYNNKPLNMLLGVVLQTNISELGGLREMLMGTYSGMGFISSTVGLRSLAAMYIKQADNIAVESNKLVSLGYARQLSSLHYFTTGQLERSVVESDKSLAAFSALGDRRQVGVVLTIKSLVLLWNGQIEPALQIYEELYHQAERQHDQQVQATALLGEASCRLLQNSIGLAGDLLARATPLVDQHTALTDRANLYAVTAIYDLMRGDYAQAESAANQLTDLLGQMTGVVSGFITHYVAAAEVYLSLLERNDPTERAKLQAAAQKALAALTKFGRTNSLGRAHALLCQGRYEWQTDQPSKAMASWYKARKFAQQTNFPYQEALARYEIGRHLPPSHPLYAENLAEALQTFRRLGMSYYVTQLQSLLSQPELNS